MPLQIRVLETVGAWLCRAQNPMKKEINATIILTDFNTGLTYAVQDWIPNSPTIAFSQIAIGPTLP